MSHTTEVNKHKGDEGAETTDKESSTASYVPPDQVWSLDSRTSSLFSGRVGKKSSVTMVPSWYKQTRAPETGSWKSKVKHITLLLHIATCYLDYTESHAENMLIPFFPIVSKRNI